MVSISQLCSEKWSPSKINVAPKLVCMGHMAKFLQIDAIKPWFVKIPMLDELSHPKVGALTGFYFKGRVLPKRVFQLDDIDPRTIGASKC